MILKKIIIWRRKIEHTDAPRPSSHRGIPVQTFVPIFLLHGLNLRLPQTGVRPTNATIRRQSEASGQTHRTFETQCIGVKTSGQYILQRSQRPHLYVRILNPKVRPVHFHTSNRCRHNHGRRQNGLFSGIGPDRRVNTTIIYNTQQIQVQIPEPHQQIPRVANHNT